jgi:hypothetical protein
MSNKGYRLRIEIHEVNPELLLERTLEVSAVECSLEKARELANELYDRADEEGLLRERISDDIEE